MSAPVLLRVRRRRVTKREARFTIIELVGVIAVVVLPIGLLLPAVQKVREGASRDSAALVLQAVYGGRGSENAEVMLPPEPPDRANASYRPRGVS